MGRAKAVFRRKLVDLNVFYLLSFGFFVSFCFGDFFVAVVFVPLFAKEEKVK